MTCQAYRWLGLPRWVRSIVIIVGILTVVPALPAIGLVVFILASSDTVYSPGYSERAFKGLRIGTPVGEVEAAMGPPLSKGLWYYDVRPDREMWIYSKEGHVGAIFFRRVLFFKDGRLDHVDSELFYE